MGSEFRRRLCHCAIKASGFIFQQLMDHCTEVELRRKLIFSFYGGLCQQICTILPKQAVFQFFISFSFG